MSALSDLVSARVRGCFRVVASGLLAQARLPAVVQRLGAAARAPRAPIRMIRRPSRAGAGWSGRARGSFGSRWPIGPSRCGRPKQQCGSVEHLRLADLDSARHEPLQHPQELLAIMNLQRDDRRGAATLRIDRVRPEVDLIEHSSHDHFCSHLQQVPRMTPSQTVGARATTYPPAEMLTKRHTYPAHLPIRTQPAHRVGMTRPADRHAQRDGPVDATTSRARATARTG